MSFLNLLLFLFAVLAVVQQVTASSDGGRSDRPLRVGKLPITGQVSKLARSVSTSGGGLSDGVRRGLTSLSDVQNAGASATVGFEQAGKHLVAGVKGTGRSAARAHQARKEGDHCQTVYHSVSAAVKPVAAISAASASAVVGVAAAAGFGLKAVGNLAAIPYDAVRHRNASKDDVKKEKYQANNLNNVVKHERDVTGAMRSFKKTNSNIADFIRGPKKDGRSFDRSASMSSSSSRQSSGRHGYSASPSPSHANSSRYPSPSQASSRRY